MASSSARIGGYTYDVFLSFRGEDTRNNFVDHLYSTLVQKGIRAFKDDEILHRGKPISPELLKSIEESRFAVVVFSRNYANSSWCLDELAKIIECQDRLGQKVLPVFYHVDPSDVRGQKGDFGMAFLQHEERFREEMDKVRTWRKALAGAGNLSGWHISAVNGGESLFINQIVQVISRGLQPHVMRNNLIGIESRINELESKLDLEATQEVRMVGVYGMGGIGKTTIVQALFKKISYMFEGSSFVKSVRENSKTDIGALQEKILNDILMTPTYSELIKKEDVAEMIQTRFCEKKVLLVLDDVDDVTQLESLAASHEWFGAGSRIIITTRDERLLSYTDAKFKPAFLLMDQAVELFSRHAFRKNSPPKGYEELSDRAVRYTCCLPLALKVLGSFFHGRQAGVWDSAFNRLAKTPDRKIFETLKISFDGLEVSEKKIFLDIACFFKGEDEELVTRILDSFGFDPVIGISVLMEKSLITVSNKRLHVHDLLQEMGLEIVRESYPNSRLWQLEEFHDCIENGKLEAIEAIVVSFDSCYDNDMCFRADVFGKMKNLRLFDIDFYGNFISCEPTILPDGLQWLRWNGYPFSSLHVENMHKLVGLEISHADIEYLWIGQKVMPCLKFIHLERLDYLERFPDVSGAPYVERLILSDCENLGEVHESLGSHRRLVYLNMSGCSQLKCLPFRLEMESLETLDLTYCSSLEKFPDVSPCMVKLSNIYLDECESLENIPNSICELTCLKSLHLNNCMELQKLPKVLGSMEKLEELWLGFEDYNKALQEMSKSINFHALTSLSCLKKLDLSWRQIKYEDFPDNFHAFSSLEELHLSGNSSLIQLPASISRLSHLKHLEVNCCRQLQNLLTLPSGIQVLKASNCKALEKIEDLTEKYAWLYKIWLPGCKKLLKNQENEKILDKMLHQSFLKKQVVLDCELSIVVPGSNIPSWFKNQRYGKQIALKLPLERHTTILGFMVCSVIEEWDLIDGYPSAWISFTIKNIEKFLPQCISATPAAAVGDKNVWIAYIPFSFIKEQMHPDFEPGHDWSLFVEGALLITILLPSRVVRCGAHVVYKDDIQNKTRISNYWNPKIYRLSENSFVYGEKLMRNLRDDSQTYQDDLNSIAMIITSIVKKLEEDTMNMRNLAQSLLGTNPLLNFS